MQERLQFILSTGSTIPDDSASSSLLNALRNAKVLIIDDEPINVAMLNDMLLEAGYRHIHVTTDPHDAISLYRSLSPDLILLDLMMPGIDGLGVMQQLKEECQGRIEVPILMLTADISPQTKRKALMEGAKDFLTKPFDMVELLLRIYNLLETHFLYRDLQQQNVSLEDRVQARTVELQAAQEQVAQYAEELEEAHLETLERLAMAGEFRDDETGQHTQRVGKVAAMLAEKLGYSSEELRWMHQAARLHDVGKIGVSDLILLKPGKLTEAEFATMQTHTTIGARLFSGGRTEVIQLAQRIAASHHERWDGAGYPLGLQGEDIPLEGRILAVADVFDALTHNRPYKNAWSVEDAVDEIERQSGSQFDPQIVKAFMELPHDNLI